MNTGLTSANARRLLTAVLGGLIALLSPLAVSATPETGFVISEIMFDPVGNDNTRQWIELYNGTSADITLSDYSLGWGRNDYTRGVLQLSGVLGPWETWIVGGPNSDAGNGNPAFSPNGQALDLDPNLQKGDNASRPDGVALFMLPAGDIVRGSDPIHAVIYGRSTATPRPWLTDESAAANSGVILVTTDGMVEGQSIAMGSDGSWQVQSVPSPGLPSIPEPGTYSLLLAGLTILAARRRITGSA